MNEASASKRATFMDMKHSTAADWAIIATERQQLLRELPEQIIRHLLLMKGDYGGFPVDRLHHRIA